MILIYASLSHVPNNNNNRQIQKKNSENIPLAHSKFKKVTFNFEENLISNFKHQTAHLQPSYRSWMGIQTFWTQVENCFFFEFVFSVFFLLLYRFRGLLTGWGGPIWFSAGTWGRKNCIRFCFYYIQRSTMQAIL